MKKNAGKAVKAAAAVLLFVYCLLDTEGTAWAVRSSLRRCTETVIPSLFAVMAAASVIVRSGITAMMPKWTAPVGRLLFGMEPNELSVFTFSMAAGYPVGLRMICEEYAAGRISPKRAELLAGLCFGAGPAFVFGCISRQLYGSAAAGQLILLSAVSANVILALIMSVPLRRCRSVEHNGRSFDISADMLTDCVLGSGRAMADICVMIVFFAVVTRFLVTTGAAAAAGELLGKLPGLGRIRGEALVAAFLDVTNAEALPRGDWLLLPYISGLTSFGGVCVMFQLSVVARGRISVMPLIIMRAAAGVVSFFVSMLLLPYFMAGETVEVSAAVGTSAPSPVPSVMLVIMTFMLMLEYGRKKNGKEAYIT